jgi:hypothetical protein
MHSRPQNFSHMCLLFLLYCAAQIIAADNILSIGNSLIEFNDQPAMIESLAAKGKHELKWTHRFQSGQSLLFHYDQGIGLDDVREPTARNLIRQGGWTHIVLQEFSSWPRENVTGFFTAVRLFKEEISIYCPDAKIYLFENWPYNDSGDYSADLELLDENYAAIANEISAKVFPVAHGFDLLRTKDKFKKLDPYVVVDNKHPSVLGSYLAACIISRMLYPRPAKFLRTYPSSLTPHVARILQKRAKQVLKRSPFSRL